MKENHDRLREHLAESDGGMTTIIISDQIDAGPLDVGRYGDFSYSWSLVCMRWRLAQGSNGLAACNKAASPSQAKACLVRAM